MYRYDRPYNIPEIYSLQTLVDQNGGTPVGTVVCWNQPSIAGANNITGKILYWSPNSHAYAITNRSDGGPAVEANASYIYLGACPGSSPPTPPPSTPTPTPPGTTPPPPPGTTWTCSCPNDGTNYCVSGTCIPKTYAFYGVVGVGALFILSLLK